MGLKKKRNIIYLTLCMVTCYILYQLYFFLAITSENNNFQNFVHIRSEADKFINQEGIVRGVSIQNMVKYRPDGHNNFKCLNTNEYIPYDRVNDDYCDCEDGTDEPSTNACPNGVFSCELKQKKLITSQQVPSSRVNDGICDCCDGSDEWIHDPQGKLLSQRSDSSYRFYVPTCPHNC